MFGGHSYGGVGYAGSDVAEIPQNDGLPTLAVEVAFTTDALATPAWVDITGDVREWDTRRGRNRELERFQPGRATVVLGNNDRRYDSVHASGPWFGNLKPMRRIRIRETFNGVTYPVFDGFVDKWQLDYPQSGKDATATVTATDAFKVFARTDLPVSVYDEVVLADEPEVYWRLDETKTSFSDDNLAALNKGSLGSSANGTYVGPPRLGDEGLVVNDPGSSIGIVNPDEAAGTEDMGVKTESADFALMANNTDSFVVEAWCVPRNEPGVNGYLWYQDNDAGNAEALAFYTAAQAFSVNVIASGGGVAGATSTGPHPPHARYHIVVRVVLGEFVKLWVNGVLTTGASGPPTGTWDDRGPFTIGHEVGASGANNWSGSVSHVAVWRGAAAEAVDQDWVDRHLDAGTAPWNADLPGARLDRVLDEADWPDGLREIDAGITSLQSAAIDGQTVLDHAQKVGETEFGLLFIDRAGNVRFIDREGVFGRDPDPDVIFGDDGTEIRYRDFVPDDGDEVIRNRAIISQLNGVPATAEDTASVAEFGRFDYKLDGLLHDSLTYSQDYANLIRDEYKDPRRRIRSLTLGPAELGAEADLYPQMLGRELGDAIVVKNRPPGGGDAFEQTCVIEGIRHQGVPPGHQTTTWILSPEFSVRALEDEDVATLGYAEATADQTGILAAADLTNLSVEVTVGSNRRIRITGYVNQFTNTAGSSTFVGLLINEGATQLNGYTAAMNDTYSGAICMAVETPTAGAHTYKLRATSDGTVTAEGSATTPNFILVEDIGPA